MTAVINGRPKGKGIDSEPQAYWLGKALPHRPSVAHAGEWSRFVRHVRDGVSMAELGRECGRPPHQVREEIVAIHRLARVAAGN